MKAKYNAATKNRPFGSRFTDGDILKIDLPAYVRQLKAEENGKGRDRNAVTVFKSDTITITLIILLENAEMIPGNYEGMGIMSLQVMSGKLQFKNGENTITLITGQLATVHKHIPFNVIALEETLCLLTMIK